MLGSFAALPLILITSFDPFGGARINNSNLVSAKLAELLGSQFEVHECLVPTVYDQSFEEAKKCLEGLPRKPDLILSMGEGSPCNEVNIEMRTTNIDNTFMEDNAGNLRQGHVIIPGEPEEKQFHFEDKKLKKILKKIQGIERSNDMGQFVCNNIAYHLLTYLQQNTDPQIPYTFIHVPPHQCGKTGLTVNESAGVISELLTRVSSYR